MKAHSAHGTTAARKRTQTRPPLTTKAFDVHVVVVHRTRPASPQRPKRLSRHGEQSRDGLSRQGRHYHHHDCYWERCLWIWIWRWRAQRFRRLRRLFQTRPFSRQWEVLRCCHFGQRRCAASRPALAGTQKSSFADDRYWRIDWYWVRIPKSKVNNSQLRAFYS